MHIFNILQVPKLWMACLMVKFGEAPNIFDVLMKYEILGFCRLGLNQRKFY